MLTNVNKDQKLVWFVIFHFCSNPFRKWWCLLHLILYKDVYIVYVNHTFVWSSEAKALVTKTAFNDEKCHHFC